VLNYIFMLYKSGRMKEDSGLACECVKEITSYRSGISTLPDQLHIIYTDVCPKISPYQVQTDCNVVAVPRVSRHKFCCLSLLTKYAL